jgi:hypothetical protein
MADTPNLILATSNLPQVLVSGYLAGVETTVYQCPANKSTTVGTATMCNSSASTVTVELSVAQTGGTAGASNRVAIVSLEADESTVVEELVGLLLGPGDFISGLASATSAVSIALSGAVSA